MPSRILNTGPAELYVSFIGAAGPYFFLGTAERAPYVEIYRTETPVFNDVGGDEPVDMMWHGESALISAEMNRLDEAIGIIVETAPSHTPGGGGGAAPAAGTNIAAEIGGLIVADNLGMSLVMRFPFVGSVNNIAGGLPPGYRFFCTTPIGPDRITPGTRPLNHQFVWKAQRVYIGPDGTVSGAGGGRTLPAGVVLPGGFALYDNTMPTLPVPT